MFIFIYQAEGKTDFKLKIFTLRYYKRRVTTITNPDTKKGVHSLLTTRGLI